MPEFGRLGRFWLVLAAALVVLLLARGRIGFDGDIVGAVQGISGPAETGSVEAPPALAIPGSGRSGDANGGASSGPNGTVLVNGALMLPLSVADVGLGGSLASFGGGRAVGTWVRVQSVPANEGFWIGTSAYDRVWVQLVGPPPESPYDLHRGEVVSFSAPLRANPPGFASSVGVTRSEGAAMLTAQGQHIAVPKLRLKVRRH